MDFFPPVTDDAATWGRIAAANAASDIYAMGGRPLFALNVVVWPKDRLPLELLGEVLGGGAAAAAEGGWHIVGGHTTDGPEPVYGQAVIGEVDRRRMMTKAGALPDQELILTKPLGTGIITTAHKRLPPPDDAPAEGHAAGATTESSGPPPRADIRNVRYVAESAADISYRLSRHRLSEPLQQGPEESETVGEAGRPTWDGRQEKLAVALSTAIEYMCQLNDKASEMAVEAGVTGATDVTGFGLLGHLQEMCAASYVGAWLGAPRVLTLPFAAEFAAGGFVPGGTDRNLAAARPHLDRGLGWGGGGSEGSYRLMGDLLADPQTSGGLLLACPPETASDLLESLLDTGHMASVVGRTLSRIPPGRIELDP